MNNLTLALVVGVALLSSGGCKSKPNGGAEYVAAMKGFKDKMCACKDRACAEKVTEEMTRWSADAAKKSNGKAEGKPDDKVMKEMAALSDEMTKCMTAAMSAGGMEGGAAGGGNPVVDTTVAAGGDLPECNDYKGMIEKLAGCEKLTQQARDQLRQAYEQSSKTWGNISAMPEEARKSMAASCKQGADALRHATAAACGW